MSVAVLMYHGVGEQPAPHSEPRYTVPAARFEEHLDLLLGGGARVTTLDALLSGQAGDGDVVLTFDDGEASVASAALPTMARRGLTGTVFVTSDWLGQPGYLTLEQLLELRDADWIIGAHGATHRYLSGLSDADLAEELTGSREALALLLGRPVLHMSLPGGRADARVTEAARQAGYHSMCTSRVGRAPRRPDPYGVKRLAVLRGVDDATLAGMVRGDLQVLAKLQGRAALLDGAKRIFGDRGYDALRGVAMRVLKRG